MSALKSDVNNANSGAELMVLSRLFNPNLAITGGTRVKGAAHLRVNRLFMERVSFENRDYGKRVYKILELALRDFLSVCLNKLP